MNTQHTHKIVPHTTLRPINDIARDVINAYSKEYGHVPSSVYYLLHQLDYSNVQLGHEMVLFDTAKSIIEDVITFHDREKPLPNHTELIAQFRAHLTGQYTAITLSEQQRIELLQLYSSHIPKGWEISCHHITLSLSEIPERLGEVVTGIPVTHIAADDNAVALFVDYPRPLEGRAHITLAFNKAKGAKPYHSNTIPESCFRVVDSGLTVGGVICYHARQKRD